MLLPLCSAQCPHLVLACFLSKRSRWLWGCIASYLRILIIIIGNSWGCFSGTCNGRIDMGVKLDAIISSKLIAIVFAVFYGTSAVFCWFYWICRTSSVESKLHWNFESCDVCDSQFDVTLWNCNSGIFLSRGSSRKFFQLKLPARERSLEIWSVPSWMTILVVGTGCVRSFMYVLIQKPVMSQSISTLLYLALKNVK